MKKSKRKKKKIPNIIGAVATAAAATQTTTTTITTKAMMTKTHKRPRKKKPTSDLLEHYKKMKKLVIPIMELFSNSLNHPRLGHPILDGGYTSLKRKRQIQIRRPTMVMMMMTILPRMRRNMMKI